MSLTFSLLKPPLPSHAKPHSLSSPFFHGFKLPSLTLSSPPSPTSSTTTTFPIIRAMKSMQGRVVCSTNDKTVAVEVTRLAPHPKYKRRVRKKKKYQAHDPENQFQVGDWVQLEKCRPISKTKTFLAIFPTALPKSVPTSAEPGPVQSQIDEVE